MEAKSILNSISQALYLHLLCEYSCIKFQCVMDIVERALLHMEKMYIG